MKPFLFILLSFSFCYSWGQEFIKDTLLIEFEGKTVQYIIGKTTAIEVQADFPELKLTLKDNRHASRNFQYKIRLGSIKNGLQFDFYHKAEFKEDILLSESTLSRVSTRPRKGLTINDLNCDIKNKNALKNIPFKTDTFFQSFRNNRKYESLTSDSENFTILFKGKKKKVTKISFNESFETQVFNQDVYEEWKSLTDSTEMCQNILNLVM